MIKVYLKQAWELLKQNKLRPRHFICCRGITAIPAFHGISLITDFPISNCRGFLFAISVQTLIFKYVCHYRRSLDFMEYLYEKIYDPNTTNPISAMPAFGKNGWLSDDEIKAVIAYLKTIN